MQKALAYIEDRRNPDGGFRYERATGTSDTSVTAWCALAQIAGSDVGIEMPAGAAGKTVGYLRSMTDTVTGRTGYSERGGLSSRYSGEPSARFPPDKSEAMTGAALFVRLALGDDPAGHEEMRAGLARCAAALPKATHARRTGRILGSRRAVGLGRRRFEPTRALADQHHVTGSLHVTGMTVTRREIGRVVQAISPDMPLQTLKV